MSVVTFPGRGQKSLPHPRHSCPSHRIKITSTVEIEACPSAVGGNYRLTAPQSAGSELSVASCNIRDDSVQRHVR
jgi:hypothetical protein